VPSNLERLIEAGLTVSEPLPQPHIDVIESLTEDEVKEIEAIVGNATYRSVVERLDAVSEEFTWRERVLPPF
jgi:hypothetical protein